MTFRRFIIRVVPHLVAVSSAERSRAAAGAFLGILAVGTLGLLGLGFDAPALLIAPFGASAVLVFAVPASPLAQPWSVIGGNSIGAAVGVTCALMIPFQPAAAATALGASIFALMVFRCLHPPSGAVALTAVLGGPTIHALGYWFVVWPVFAGSVALVGVAILYNGLTGKAYPHVARKDGTAVPADRVGGLGVSVADLTLAIRERDEVVPVDPADLEDVLQRAEVLAFRRRSGGAVAAAVMIQNVATVSPRTSLRVALRLLRSNGIKAVPVVDAGRHVVGILTQTDMLYKADWGPSPDGSARGWRLRASTNSDRPLKGLARDVMTTAVCCLAANTPIARVVQLMVQTGHHDMPVVAEDGVLVGMVNQADVMAAFFRANQTELEAEALPMPSAV